MIRPARPTDRPALVALMKEGHKRSRYAKSGHIVDTILEQFIRGMILKHGSKAVDGTFCNVIEHDGKIVGLHFGAKERIKIFGSKYYASDALFYVQPGHSLETVGLVAQFVDWAKADPRVIEISLGATDDIDDYKTATKIYERMGFTQCGSMMRCETRSAA